MMRYLALSVGGLVGAIWRNYALLGELTRRELKFARIGVSLGLVWVVGIPAFLLLFYMLLFSTLFQPRAGNGAGAVIYILAGLVGWLFTVDVLGRASETIVGNRSLVKHVLFPLEVLPLSAVAAGLVSYAIQLAVLLVVALVGRGASWMLLMALPLAGLHIVCLVGISIGLSIIGVIVRDVSELVRIALVVGLFAAPILYTLDALPAWAQAAVETNPFTHMVACYQDVFFHGRLANPWSWIVFSVFAIAVFLAGAYAIRQARIYVANYV